MGSETIMAILSLMLVVVVLALLIAETLRLVDRFGELKKYEQKQQEERNAKVILIKQPQGTVRLTYSTDQIENVPDEVAVTRGAVATPEPVAVQEEEAPEGVLIPKTEKLTFQQKYERLKRADKRLIDEFTAYVVGKTDCSKVLQTSALAYKYKKSLIAKATIRRETVVLNFLSVNTELNKKVRDDNVKIKPIELRLIEREDLALAKQAVDHAVESMQEEERARLERRKEGRRKNSEANAVAESQTEVNG